MDDRQEEKEESKKKTLDDGSVEALSKKLQQQLNAEAPEFVPRSRPRPPPQIAMPMTIPIPMQASPYYNYYHHNNASNGYGKANVAFYDAYAVVNSPAGDYSVDARNSGGSNSSNNGGSSKQGSTSDTNQKILNQVEFYFSDINLATTDQLFKHMTQDPEGYVPLSVVASFKKIKAAINSIVDLANILRNSKKLLISEDGKKVKRQHPLSESDMEELQSRIIIAENLPDDHSHQKLMKIFSSIGNVKSIRTCPPQNYSNSSQSASKHGKGDAMHSSGKFHAFVEYESVELAEKAVIELTDEGNWRNGLKVRLLLKSVAKPNQGRARKTGHEAQAIGRKDETAGGEMHHLKENQSDDLSLEPVHENQVEDNATSNTQRRERKHSGSNSAKGKSKGKGKGHGHGPGHGRNNNSMDNNNVLGCPQIEVAAVGNNDKAKTSPVPRMPDGTKGFSMGRGKSLSVKVT